MIRNRDGEVLRVFSGLNPSQVDELELWQISVMMGEYRDKPAAPVAPPDWDKRAEAYQRARERKKSRKADDG